MDFDELEQEEVARGCTEFSNICEERPFQSLAEVRVGSTARVLRDPDSVLAACSRAGIGPQNQELAGKAAGLLVKVLEKDADRTVRCAVPSLGDVWFALSALQPTQVCEACGNLLQGAACDRCGRAAHPAIASAAAGAAAGNPVSISGPHSQDESFPDASALEAEIERRVCSELEVEAELAQGGGRVLVGALLEVEMDVGIDMDSQTVVSQSQSQSQSPRRWKFADALNKAWPRCAAVFMRPEPILATLSRRITYVLKFLTVLVHLRFLPHAAAHFQSFLDTLVQPRVGLRDLVGAYLGASPEEQLEQAAQLSRTAEHKVCALARCLELALACRPPPSGADEEKAAAWLEQFSRLVLADPSGHPQESDTAAWGGWEVLPDGRAPTPLVRRTGAYTVEVWHAGCSEANGVYTVTVFDQARPGICHAFTSDTGACLTLAYDRWWLYCKDKAFYTTAEVMPRPGLLSDDWLSRPFPMIRGTPLVKVSLNASTRLLAELRSAYSEDTFQSEYRALRASGSGHVPYTVAMQARILPKYGFEGSVDGVLEMRRHTSFWCPNDRPTQKLLHDIHQLLEYGTPFTAPTHCLDIEEQMPADEGGQEEINDDQKWVLVRPVNGLCNRLCGIVAAWLLAQDLGRKLVVDWQCVKCCNCPWERLMRIPQEIEVLTEELLAQQPCLQVGLDLLDYFHAGADTNYRPPEKVRVLGMSSARDLKKVPYGSACGPAAYLDVDSQEWRSASRFRGLPFNEMPLALQLPCVCVLAFDDFYPAVLSEFRASQAERSALLNCLRPTPAVLARVPNVRPETVGVHVRRSDHLEACAFSPEDLFTARMEELVSSAPAGEEVSFFLATDSTELEARLRGQFGERLSVLAKRTLDRSLPEGIEDALADLLALAQCRTLLGSYESTFSRTAALFRCVPLAVMFRDKRARP